MEPLKNYFRIQGWKRDFDCTEEDLKGLLQKLKPDFMDINFATLGYLIPATLEEIQTTTSFDGMNTTTLLGIFGGYSISKFLKCFYKRKIKHVQPSIPYCSKDLPPLREDY